MDLSFVEKLAPFYVPFVIVAVSYILATATYSLLRRVAVRGEVAEVAYDLQSLFVALAMAAIGAIGGAPHVFGIEGNVGTSIMYAGLSYLGSLAVKLSRRKKGQAFRWSELLDPPGGSLRPEKEK